MISISIGLVYIVTRQTGSFFFPTTKKRTRGNAFIVTHFILLDKDKKKIITIKFQSRQWSRILHRISHVICSCKLSHELRPLDYLQLCSFFWVVNWRFPFIIRIHRYFIIPLKVSAHFLASTCDVGSERVVYCLRHP